MQYEYTEEQVSEILKIFASNKIKIEFSDKNELLTSLNKIADKSAKYHSNNFFHSTRLLKLLEYDIDTMKVISNGVGYPLRFFNYTANQYIPKCIDNILKMFSGYDGPILDFMANFGMMFSGENENNYEGSYFWINREIFSEITDDTKPYFLENIFVAENHRKFICNNNNFNIHLDYIGFNKKNNISKYAFVMPSQVFVSKNPMEHYSKYCNFDKVFLMIQDDSTYNGVSLQLTPNSNDYFAIEIPLSIDEYSPYIQKMITNGIINQKTGDKLASFNYGNIHHFMLKYRWKNINECQIKVYTEEYLK